MRGGRRSRWSLFVRFALSRGPNPSGRPGRMGTLRTDDTVHRGHATLAAARMHGGGFDNGHVRVVDGAAQVGTGYGCWRRDAFFFDTGRFFLLRKEKEQRIESEDARRSRKSGWAILMRSLAPLYVEPFSMEN